MKIIFSALGFQSADVYLEVDGRQLPMGIIADLLCRGNYQFWFSDYFTEQYVKRSKYVKRKDIPRNDEVIAEYIKQLKAKGCGIQPGIQYAV